MASTWDVAWQASLFIDVVHAFVGRSYSDDSTCPLGTGVPLLLTSVLEGFGRHKEPHGRQQRQGAGAHHPAAGRAHQVSLGLLWVVAERGRDNDVHQHAACGGLGLGGAPEDERIEEDAAADGEAVGPFGQLGGRGCGVCVLWGGNQGRVVLKCMYRRLE